MRIGVAARTHLEMVGLVRLVAHVAQAHGAGHVLQFAVAVGRAGQAIEGMVGDIKLHHPAAQLAHLFRMGMDDHALGHRRRAGGGRAAPALDLHDAEPARPEGRDIVGGAQLRHLDPGKRGGPHDAGALRHVNLEPVDGQADGPVRRHRGGAEVTVIGPRNDEILHGLAPLFILAKILRGARGAGPSPPPQMPGRVIPRPRACRRNPRETTAAPTGRGRA